MNPRTLRRLVSVVVAGLFASSVLAEDARPIRSIGVLVLPGVYNSELMAPYDVLQHLKFHVDDAPEIFTVAPRPGPLTTFEGLTLTPRYSFADAPDIDLLVVPSAEHNMDSDLENVELIDWVRRVGGNARLLLSLCDGAFVLAQAGLLDDLEATTFPGDQDRFEKAFPKLKLQRDVLFVHDGKAVTSVGGAKSYEASLFVVERIYGKKAADGIARGLVIDWRLDALRFRQTPAARLP